MSEKSITICTELIPATLDGRKTVTRRVIKNMPESWHRGYRAFENNPNGDEEFIIYGDCGIKIINPRYSPGDLLWVKETYCHGDEWDDCKPSEVDPLCGGNDIWYLADGPRPTEGWGKTRSSRFMPKWVSRTWLEVVSIRVERLQEITEEDAVAEGIEIGKVHGETAYYLYNGRACWTPNPIESFKTLWDSLNAKRGYSWDSNPWVWRISFQKREGK